MFGELTKLLFLFLVDHHQSVLPNGRSLTANSGTKVAVLSKGRSSTANSGTKVALLLGINRRGSFPLLSAPHSLFRMWTHRKRSEKIPGTPARRWGEKIWPFGLHRKLLQRLNISSIRVFDQFCRQAPNRRMVIGRGTKICFVQSTKDLNPRSANKKHLIKLLHLAEDLSLLRMQIVQIMKSWIYL